MNKYLNRILLVLLILFTLGFGCHCLISAARKFPLPLIRFLFRLVTIPPHCWQVFPPLTGRMEMLALPFWWKEFPPSEKITVPL